MRIKCQDCKQIRETLMSDPKTWPCPCDTTPASTQTFTVDPYAVRTQFAPATRPTFQEKR